MKRMIMLESLKGTKIFHDRFIHQKIFVPG